MEFYVEAGPKTKKFIESILPSMLEQLGLTNCKKLLMIKIYSLRILVLVLNI